MNILKIVLTLILGVFIQVMCIFADVQDSPNKALVNFAKAYYKFNPDDMKALLCEESLKAEGGNPISIYMGQVEAKAAELGFGLWYISDFLYDIRTETLNKDYEEATIRLTATAKNPVRKFFKGDVRQIDTVADLVWDKDDRRWKVCGNITEVFPQ